MAKEELPVFGDGLKVLEPVLKDPGDQLQHMIDTILAPPVQKATEPPPPASVSPFQSISSSGSAFADPKPGLSRTQLVLVSVGVIVVAYFLLKGK